MFNYNDIKTYGESTIDYIKTENTILTQAQIDSTLSPTYIPSWDYNTIFLAQFNHNLNAGNVEELEEQIQSWLIYKKQNGDALLTYVDEVPYNQFKITDYNVGSNSSYQYILFGVTEHYITKEMLINEGEYITNRWQSWYIIDVVDDKQGGYYVNPNNLWKFNTNLSSDALTQNIDRFTFEGFTQYPKISQSTKNYITGTITAYLSNVYNGQYEDTLSQQNAFNEFINNGNMKLLKDRKGNTLLVNTTSNTFKYIDVSPQQITEVSFSYTQLKDSINVSILEEV